MPSDDSTTQPDADGEPTPDADLRPDDPAADVAPEIPQAPDLTDDEPGLAEELGFGGAEASTESEPSVDSELATRFWSLALLFNLALLAASLGLLLIGFERRWTVGGGLLAVGVFAFVRGWYRYRSVRKD
ncbi:DUF7322 domain-containing protein [Halorussus marinus]|uniref:DUF7322 domain-containing protein n=1 Tax=Halorussus marinus TaxID=2505976 RepID=UPI00106E2585|nr:hypothetical protein [Halorussus marinus]